jgi:NDP-sugar pyrophosphorylase family protein
MNYQNFKTGHDKASKFTAEQYGTKVSVEVDHSDMDLDEVMDAFQTLIIGMGYHENSFKNWVIDRADEYRETDAEELKEKLDAWKFEEDYTGQFEDWKNETPTIEDDEETSNKRMDIIGQNGNEGLHYRATEEDEAEFDDYGMRIAEDKVGFEWGDEPEDDNLFEGDSWFANDNLKEANEKYKKALKTLSAKQKKKSK